MPSIHGWKAIEKARALGGFAGVEAALPLWELSKRELIEIALRLGALNEGECDNPQAGVNAAMNEFDALQRANII